MKNFVLMSVSSITQWKDAGIFNETWLSHFASFPRYYGSLRAILPLSPD